MGDITMEQKLRLVQQARSRYQENQYDMSNREWILYGKPSQFSDSEYANPYSDMYGGSKEPVGGYISFFKLRLWAAIFFLAVIIFLDKSGIKVAGITTEEIFRAISADYDEKIEEWVETLSYNLPQR